LGCVYLYHAVQNGISNAPIDRRKQQVEFAPGYGRIGGARRFCDRSNVGASGHSGVSPMDAGSAGSRGLNTCRTDRPMTFTSRLDMAHRPRPEARIGAHANAQHGFGTRRRQFVVLPMFGQGVQARPTQCQQSWRFARCALVTDALSLRRVDLENVVEAVVGQVEATHLEEHEVHPAPRYRCIRPCYFHFCPPFWSLNVRMS
jgi:hypothetical protein